MVDRAHRNLAAFGFAPQEERHKLDRDGTRPTAIIWRPPGICGIRPFTSRFDLQPVARQRDRGHWVYLRSAQNPAFLPASVATSWPRIPRRAQDRSEGPASPG